MDWGRDQQSHSPVMSWQPQGQENQMLPAIHIYKINLKDNSVEKCANDLNLFLQVKYDIGQCTQKRLKIKNSITSSWQLGSSMQNKEFGYLFTPHMISPKEIQYLNRSENYKTFRRKHRTNCPLDNEFLAHKSTIKQRKK